MAKEWYDKNIFLNIFWTLTFPADFLVGLYFKVTKTEKPKWYRWWHNRTDNLWDAGKEWIHCHRIPFTNKQFNISFMMKNRETYGKFIREHKCWSNCDPEDFKE